MSLAPVMKRRNSRTGPALRRLAAGLALALFCVSPAPVEADDGGRFVGLETDPFSALVGKRRERADRDEKEGEVERFVVSSDGRVFLFQTRDGGARMKFLCRDDDPRLDCKIDPGGPAEEIFLLTGARGPRGDMIYKNAEGDLLLRIGSYGGATVFWPGDPLGQAASKSFGEDKALHLETAGRGAAHRRAQSAAAHLSALTGEPILFDVDSRPSSPAQISDAAALTAISARAAPRAAPEDYEDAPFDDAAGGARNDLPRRDAAVLADAVARVAAGMMEVADDPTGARILGVRIKSVRFTLGPAADLALDGATLIVVYDPLGDIAGRPSSAAVAQFLEESL